MPLAVGGLLLVLAHRGESLVRGGKVEGGPDLAGVCALLKTRASTLEALADQAMFFYKPAELTAESAKAVLTEENRKALDAFVEGIKALDSFTAPEIYGVIKSVMEAQGIKMGPVANPLRVLVCCADKVPQIDKTLELFGKDEVLKRIAAGIALAA